MRLTYANSKSLCQIPMRFLFMDCVFYSSPEPALASTQEILTRARALKRALFGGSITTVRQ